MKRDHQKNSAAMTRRPATRAYVLTMLPAIGARAMRCARARRTTYVLTMLLATGLIAGSGTMTGNANAATKRAGIEDPRGPIEHPDMKVAVDAGGVHADGYRYANLATRPASWQAQWIWLDAGRAAGKRPVAALFRKEIDLPDTPAQARAWVSADIRYELYVNGRPVSRGPADIGRDYNGTVTGQWLYDCRDFTPFLHRGRNVISAEVYAENLIGNYVTTGHPGFLFQADLTLPDRTRVEVKTDATWRAVPAPHLLMADWIPPDGGGPTNCLQFDARQEPVGWRLSGFDAARWPLCSPAGDFWEPLAASELPPLMEARYPAVGIVRASANVRAPQHPFLRGGSVTLSGDGSFAVRYDRVLSAHVGLRVRGAAGAVLAIQPNEPNAPGFHRMAALVLRDGEQCFELPFLDSFSVINIVATHVTRPIEIMDVSAVFTSYPVAYRGAFACSDDALNRIWNVSRWACQICMQTHHLDSPHHQEPICDPGDYLIEALQNYYAFDDAWLARQDLRKFALILHNCHYSNFHTSYSLLWLQMLLDYYDYTGDRALIEELAPTVHGLLARYATWRGKNGLISEAPDYMFMDWVTIAGFACHHPPAVIGQGYLTAFYYRGLEDARRVALITGDAALAERYEQIRGEVAEAFNRELWNGDRGLYRDGRPFQTSVKPGDWLPEDTNIETFSPHVNTLAVLYDLAPKDRQPLIMRKVLAEKPLNVQPYFMHFVLNAIAHAGLFDACGTGQMRRWTVVQDTQSFHEMWDSGDLSHAWGGTPLYQLSARVLGVTPLEPGFRSLSIRPSLADLSWARGVVPTPRGPVRSEWKREHERFLQEASIPAGCRAKISLPAADLKDPTLTVNGAAVWKHGAPVGTAAGVKSVRLEDDRIVLEVAPGDYHMALTALTAPVTAEDRWPQAAGPDGNWAVRGHQVPIHWSVTRDQNILWRTTLPETGQSGIAVWGDRLFLTTMKPLTSAADSKDGHDIVGYCLDSRTGRILWTVDIPGSEDSTYAYGFSDSTSPSPITDGSYVWFYNASGAVGCWDYQGKQIWVRRWKPTTGRPFNKQFEPMLIGETLLNMEPRDETDPKREADPWNYLRGLDKRTGRTLWVSEDSLTHYNTPVAGVLPDGTPAVLQGRGGYHDVPEQPVGLTLTSLAPGQEGKALWRWQGRGKALYTQHWDRKYAYWLDLETSEHQVIDIRTGRLIKTRSLRDRVDYRRYDPQTGRYELLHDVDLRQMSPPLSVFPAWFCNIATEGYHYFLCFTDAGQQLGPPYCVGRIDIVTGRVEYLELPVQVVRKPGEPDRFLWGQPQPSSTVNSRGIDVAGDPRSRRDGWYWCFLGSPTEVDGKIFFTTMLGVTYVIDARAKTLDAKALLAVNDLGPAGETWSLNSISYAGGRLFHRSMKEVVCIGAK